MSINNKKFRPTFHATKMCNGNPCLIDFDNILSLKEFVKNNPTWRGWKPCKDVLDGYDPVNKEHKEKEII